jgi:hypothetical protein
MRESGGFRLRAVSDYGPQPVFASKHVNFSNGITSLQRLKWTDGGVTGPNRCLRANM